MSTFSDTFYQIILHPLFLLVVLFVIVAPLRGNVAVWVRLGSGHASSDPAAEDNSPANQEKTRAAYPGTFGR